MIINNRLFAGGKYCISIPEGKFFEHEGAYYCALKDGQEFSFGFDGPRGTKAKLEIYIQGEPMHLNETHHLMYTYDGDTATLKRPLHVDKAFTFFATEGKMGKHLGIQNMDPHKRGLVEIYIYPEIQKQEVYRGEKTRNISGAATLGAATGQKFSEGKLKEISDKPVEFIFRLVEKRDEDFQVIGAMNYPKPL